MHRLLIGYRPYKRALLLLEINFPTDRFETKFYLAFVTSTQRTERKGETLYVGNKKINQNTMKHVFYSVYKLGGKSWEKKA